MKLRSTRGGGETVSFAQAVLRGMAEDGGLYLPVDWPQFGKSEIDALRGLSFPDLGAALSVALLGDELPAPELAEIARSAFSFPIPLRKLDDSTWLLELFHGPTLAFKDVAARFLARLLPKIAAPPLTVLVATSGDTGGAVANAFHRVDGVRVVVLYPRRGVSSLQEKQIASLGDNVVALSVDGTFDDCQRLVKAAFADPELTKRVRLLSANSINIGRLLPQSFYYVHAALALDAPVDLISVPTGNLGNLTAGLLASRLGAPLGRLIAATNANRTLADSFAAGAYQARPSVATLSNAMDVGAPSNFERLFELEHRDWAGLTREVIAESHDDDATIAAMRDVERRTGVLLDPHTAVGWLGLEGARRRGLGTSGIVVATAHPAKFAETLEPLIGHPIELPPELAAVAAAPVLARKVDVDSEALRAVLIEF